MSKAVTAAPKEVRTLFEAPPLFETAPSFAVSLNPMLQKIMERGRIALAQDENFLENNSHPSGRYGIGVVDLEKLHGPYLYTSKGYYFDYTYHWMTDLLDRKKHQELDENNLLLFLGALSFEKPTPTEITTEIQASFVKMMQEFFSRGDKEKESNFTVLPVSAGVLGVADAIDNAKGLVAEKYLKEGKTIEENQLKGIAFGGAFHGRYDDPADGTSNKEKTGHKWNNKITRVEEAPIIIYNQDGSVDENGTEELFEQSMAQVERSMAQDEHAYVIIEYPFQAEGGARLVNPNALRRLNEICQKNGKLLIVDNVQMSGRSWTINPDGSASPFTEEVLKYAHITTFGKVFHANGSVYDLEKIKELGLNPEFIREKGPQRLGGTHTSSMHDMLSGMMVMQTIQDKKLWENLFDKSNKLYAGLQTLSEAHPDILQKVRMREDTGYLAWSFPSNGEREKFWNFMKDNEHIIFLRAGKDSIRIAPAPDMTQKELDGILIAVSRQLKRMDNK